MNINVLTVIGKTAVSREGGLKLKKELDRAIESNEFVEVDFEGVQVYASPFFNTAIAPYLGKMKFNEMKEKFTCLNLSPIGRKLLNQVIHNAIDFYSKNSDEQNLLEDQVGNGLE
jgi:hypothetical protein